MAAKKESEKEKASESESEKPAPIIIKKTDDSENAAIFRRK